ncbi:MAG TPA: hypothetical protein DE045_04225 [Oceanospirillaceae bacterium]|nr:hypothetical protein [Oceanospirillaceae bacterium]
MQFLALIYNSEGSEDVGMPDIIEQYTDFAQRAHTAGVMTGGNGLQPISTATSVQIRNGKQTIVDGPFAETKEQLGGYFLLQCKDLDEAIMWAAQIPTARYGTIEVRPVKDYG